MAGRYIPLEAIAAGNFGKASASVSDLGLRVQDVGISGPVFTVQGVV